MGGVVLTSSNSGPVLANNEGQVWNPWMHQGCMEVQVLVKLDPKPLTSG